MERIQEKEKAGKSVLRVREIKEKVRKKWRIRKKMREEKKGRKGEKR